jgi:hypothetical protein
MRGGVILIVIALIVGYMGVTGKYQCFSKMLGCLMGEDDCNCGGKQATAGKDVSTLTFPKIAPLTPIPPLTPPFAGVTYG